jgi:hypothetical protein
MTRISLCTAFVLAGASIAWMRPGEQAVGATGRAPAVSVRRAPATASAAPRFVENAGQWAGDVSYLAVGRERTVVLKPRSMTLVQTSGARRCAVEYAFEGARDVRPRAESPTRAMQHYFRGSATARHARTFSSVAYDDVWPGIGVRLDARRSAVEYSVVVAPGADAAAAQFRVRGATRVERTAGGALAVASAAGTVTHSRPVAWQEIDGRRKDVDVAFDVGPRREDGTWTYGFALGEHDASRAVVVDPEFELTAFETGLDSGDRLYGIAADAQGSAYACGQSGWSGAVAAAVAGYDATIAGVYDAWIGKFDSDGTLLWATFLGGAAASQSGSSDMDIANDIAVGADGEAVVCGMTNSSDFPKVGGPSTGSYGGATAWIARLAADGASLVHSGTPGGSNPHVAVHADGSAALAWEAVASQIAGQKTATIGPATSGLMCAVARIPRSGAFESLVELRHESASPDSNLYDLAVDSAGAVYVAGEINAPGGLPPAAVKNAYGGGSSDAFVLKLDASAAACEYALCLGGSGPETGVGVAVDSTGAAWTAGHTDSSLATFPRTVGNPAGTSEPNPGRVFAARIGPGGQGAPRVWGLDTVYISVTEGGVGVDALDRVHVSMWGRDWLFASDGDEASAWGDVLHGKFAVASPRVAWSLSANEVVRVTDVSAAIPDHLDAVPFSPHAIRFSWIPTGGDETGFIVQRATGGGPFVQIATPDGDTTFFEDTGLDPDTSYSYRVIALTAVTRSEPATVTDVRTPPTIRVRVRRARVVDRSGPHADSVGVSATIRPVPGVTEWTFDPAADEVRIRIGDVFDFRVREGSDGWTPKGSGWAWEGPIGPAGTAKLRIDLARRKFTFHASGIDLPGTASGNDAVTLNIGGDAGSQAILWDNANRSTARTR